MKNIFIVLITAVFLVGFSTSNRLEKQIKKHESTLNKLVDKTWHWKKDECSVSNFKFVFEEDKKSFYLEFNKPKPSVYKKGKMKKYYYQVIGVKRNKVQCALVDETRKTPEGDLQQWYIIIKGEEFFWQRVNKPKLHGPIQVCDNR